MQPKFTVLPALISHCRVLIQRFCFGSTISKAFPTHPCNYKANKIFWFMQHYNAQLCDRNEYLCAQNAELRHSLNSLTLRDSRRAKEVEVRFLCCWAINFLLHYEHQAPISTEFRNSSVGLLHYESQHSINASVHHTVEVPWTKVMMYIQSVKKQVPLIQLKLDQLHQVLRAVKQIQGLQRSARLIWRLKSVHIFELLSFQTMKLAVGSDKNLYHLILCRQRPDLSMLRDSWKLK
jgi:hypothetical protein